MTNRNLDPKQMNALSLLLRGKSQTVVAKEIGVSRQTIGNWMKDEYFAEKLNSMQKKRIEKIVDDLYELEDRALQVIQAILENSNSKDSDRLRAADLIQRAAITYSSHQNFATRIEAIEDWMETWEVLTKAKVDWVDLKSGRVFPPDFILPKIEPE